MEKYGLIMLNDDKKCRGVAIYGVEMGTVELIMY